MHIDHKWKLSSQLPRSGNAKFLRKPAVKHDRLATKGFGLEV